MAQKSGDTEAQGPRPSWLCAPCLSVTFQASSPCGRAQVGWGRPDRRWGQVLGNALSLDSPTVSPAMNPCYPQGSQELSRSSCPGRLWPHEKLNVASEQDAEPPWAAAGHQPVATWEALGLSAWCGQKGEGSPVEPGCAAGREGCGGGLRAGVEVGQGQGGGKLCAWGAWTPQKVVCSAV